MINETLRNKLRELKEIPYEFLTEYERKQNLLIHEVMSELHNQEENFDLGEFSFEELSEIHKEHVKFMTAVFKLNYFELLLNILPWVYRVGRFRGVDGNYFLIIYNSWILALNKHLEPNLAKPLIDIYQWFIDNHSLIMKKGSKEEHFYPFEISPSWQDIQEAFLEALLNADHKKCLELSDENVSTGDDLEKFYLQVIMPSMYKIGFMWEKGDISVAHEHLATSIISRVMANLYPKFILMEESKKHKAVVTAAPNEFHEIGARMVADLLEKNSWDVNYLGADVPEKDLLDMLFKERPTLLGISAAMPYNIEKMISLINEVRKYKELNETKILVGGKIFLENKKLWRETGADAFAVDAKEAVKKAHELLK